MIRTSRGSRGSGVKPSSVILDRIAFVGIAAQFACMASISFVLWQRHALTADFAGFYHAWSAIAHGDFNPWHQDAVNVRYLQNHGELITWIFAPAYWLMPNPFGLRLVQDLSAAGISTVCYFWIRRLLPANELLLPLGLTGVALLVLDPWPFWSNSFDFHWQATGTFFLILAAYAFYLRRIGPAFVACALVACTGDVMCTILAGLGLSMILLRAYRLYGVAVIALGTIWFFAIHALGGGKGYTAAGGGLESLYWELFLPDKPHGVTLGSLVAFALSHPQNVFAALARNAKDMYANLAPAGIVGVLYPWSWGVALVTLLENNLASHALLAAADPASPLPPCLLPACLERNFAQPSFQSFSLYAFIPLGTAALLVVFAQRVRRSLTYAACAVLVANVLGWALVWLPQVPSRWILVHPAAAAQLSRIANEIPRSQEVVGGEAFLGMFAGRPVYFNAIHPAVPIVTTPANVVLAPYEGVNVIGANADLARIAALANDPRARLMSHDAGVWWFGYTAPAGTELPLPLGANVVPAWALDGITGRAVMDGPIGEWRLEYRREGGNVFQKDYWRVPLGRYSATMEIANTEPVIFEVRNASSGDVILRREIKAGPRTTHEIPFEHALLAQEKSFSGWGPFQFDPTPFGDNALELRLWSGGKGDVSVYRAGITPITRVPQPIFHR
jgi:hypothetical protein